MKHLYLLLILCGLVQFGHAETPCPWINEATVAGSPDIPVAVQSEATVDGISCRFRYQEKGTNYRLHIVVHEITIPWEMDLRCTSAGTPLRGIGKDAVMCRPRSSSGSEEQVLGHVRTRVFLVRVSASPIKTKSMTQKMLCEKAKLVSEQVAGNLF